MKIIDLLNKIAKGEEVPKKIWYRQTTLYYESGLEDYMDNCGECFNGNGLFHYLFEEETKEFLNDEIEIIEEEKEIQELNKYVFHKKQRQLANKINELVREINKLKKEGKEL